ncbi:MAG: hypothetical protein AB1422_03730 [bacterium]
MIAYHIGQTIRFKGRRKGIQDSWSRIRQILSRQVRITTTLKRKDGQLMQIRKSSKAELSHQEIYNALELPYQLGKTVKSFCGDSYCSAKTQPLYSVSC